MPAIKDIEPNTYAFYTWSTLDQLIQKANWDLATVVAVDARTVTLLFPSTGENRLYARSDFPATRVMFNPGDTITSHDGWQMQVEEVKEENGLLTYTVLAPILKSPA